MNELRYTLRALSKAPAFTAVAVITLALGIGASATLFTIINAVLLRPLPYPDSERIVSISRAVDGVDQGQVLHPEFLAWERGSRSFERLAAYRPTSATLTGEGEPVELSGAQVLPDFFDIFRVQPVLGRLFTREESAPGAAPTVLLSHDLWLGRFGASTEVLGRPITLSGSLATVVGVLPRGFAFPGRTDFWVPLQPAPTTGEIWFWHAIARLRPGISRRQARSELAGIQRRIELPTFLPATERHAMVRVITLHERLYGDTRPALLMLSGAVGFVLLIACANVANLMLARSALRRRAFAIRTALGASGQRLVREVLFESLLLALGGAALGLLVPLWGIDLFVAVSPESVGHVEGIRVDAAVLAITLGAAIVTGVVLGLAPALAVARTGPHQALKEGGLTVGRTARSRLVPRALVVAEVAAALVLLVGAGLLLKSLARITSVDPGFRSEGVLAISIYLPGSRYRDDVARRGFFQELVERVRVMPGVETAALGDAMPLEGFRMTTKVGNVPEIAITAVDPGYLRTLGIPLRAGRDFTAEDRAEAPGVAIVSASLARAVFPGLDPLGRQLNLGVAPEQVAIVGVAHDVVQLSLDVPPKPQVYRPLRQWGSPSFLFVRSSGDPAALVEPIRRAVHEIDPDQPLSGVTTMDRELADSLAPRRLNALLMGLFASVALGLAALGLYGVMAQFVTQRTHEIGVRMALGAQQRNVMQMVVRQAMGLVGVGTVLGVGLALGVTRVVRALLYQVSPTDPLVLVAAPVLLATVAGVASWLPTRRAAKVDPVVTLRYE